MAGAIGPLSLTPSLHASESPLDPDFSDRDLEALLARPEFATVRQTHLPGSSTLEDILRHESRIVECRAGDIVIREGDYGNSAFLILQGELNVIVKPALPRELLGRSARRRASGGWFRRIWRRRRPPEYRAPANRTALTSQSSRFESVLRGPVCQALFGTDRIEDRSETPPPRPDFEVVTLNRGSV
ncbi:MAG: hypothetical protein AAF493_28730, partial [Pseudomonadota bacterium]